MSDIERLELEALREVARHSLWALEFLADEARARGEPFPFGRTVAELTALVGADEPVTVDLAACVEGRR